MNEDYLSKYVRKVSKDGKKKKKEFKKNKKKREKNWEKKDKKEEWFEKKKKKDMWKNMRILFKYLWDIAEKWVKVYDKRRWRLQSKKISSKECHASEFLYILSRHKPNKKKKISWLL